MERSEFRQRMDQFKQARESNPQLSYWEWKSIPKYESGTDGVQSNTSEIPVTYSNGKWNYGYNPGAGFLKPVVSIQDAADLTPVGNAIMANDVYQSASQGDYITAGLIGAAALLPGAISKPLKKIVREIPSVNPKYFSDKINKVLGREVRPNGLSKDVYTDAINQRNRVIEDLYTDQDYWDRARAINEQYGDDYTKVYKGVLDTYENKYTGLPEPKAKSFFGDAKAEMAARKDAMERFRMNKIPAGYTDFEYNISPHLDRIDRPTAQHELGHYVDFNLSQNANADYNNNMFSALRRDLSTDNNPLYPDKTDYFRQGTEQKSYMNTLRSYMQSIGLMDRPGQKVTTKTIKRAINSLPSEMNAVRAAYLQFDSPGKYTKWFNKIPLLSIPGAAMYLDSKEDNSYSDGTDGIKYYGTYSPKQQAYVLPVYDDKGENNVVLPEVTVTPQNNTDPAGYMQKGDFIKEAMSFTPVGDVGDIYNIGKDIYNENYAQAALGAGLFFLPDIVSKPVKKLLQRGKKIISNHEIKYGFSSSDNQYAYKLKGSTEFSNDIKNRFKLMALQYPDVYGSITGAKKLDVPQNIKDIVDANIKNRRNINMDLNDIYDDIYSVNKNALQIGSKGGSFIGNAIEGSTINVSDDHLNKLIDILPHEIRHRIDYKYPLTQNEKDILQQAYGNEFVNNPFVRELVDDNYDVSIDAVTTNLDSRLKLLKNNSTLPVNLQNKIIQQSTDDKIFDAVKNSNGYGRSYIKYLEQNNMLTHELANKIRSAMMKVGVLLPISIQTLTKKEDNKNKSN